MNNYTDTIVLMCTMTLSGMFPVLDVHSPLVADITEPSESSDNDEDDRSHTLCQKCQDGGDEAQMLLCEICPAACHIYCLVPMLTQVPDEEWFCDTCLSKRQMAGCGPGVWCVVCCSFPSEFVQESGTS